MLRIVAAIVAALPLLASRADEVGAKTYARKHERSAKKPVSAQAYAPARLYGTDAYIERDANKLPFWSAIWWDQMRREGRLGGETP